MSNKKTVTTIFPSCKDEVKELEPIVFHTHTTYNDKVKIHGWHMNTLEQPKDNTDIFPPKGNLHKATYRRIGPEKTCTGVSETQAMLAQIELKDLYKPVYPQRTFVNMKTLAAEGVEEEKEFSLTDLLYDSEQAKHMDYRTTTEIDFKLPYPMKPKPLPPPPPPIPWLLYRRTLGYTLQDLERRNGYFTFLDDNLEIHHKISELKHRKNNLFELQFPNS